MTSPAARRRRAWDWLLDANGNGILYSVEKVAEELREGEDELADWVHDREETFFLEPDDQVVASLQVCSTWATTCGLYDDAAIGDFLQKADYYLIAHAHAYAHIVVTHERSANSRKTIKIPDACRGVDADCVTPFEMLRACGARFANA